MSDSNKRERLNTYLPRRLKRRLKNIADDQGLSMNEVVIDAVSDYIDRVDHSHAAPDIVLDRMSQIVVSQMAIIQAINQLTDEVRQHE